MSAQTGNSNKHKAVLICPYERIVREVELSESEDNLDEMYALLSHPEHPIDCFTSVHIDDRNWIAVDDEGLLKNPTHFFLFQGYPQPLAGRGLVLGLNSAGETVSTTFNARAIMQLVSFNDTLRVSGFTTLEDEIETVLGRTRRITQTPEFTEKGEEN